MNCSGEILVNKQELPCQNMLARLFQTLRNSKTLATRLSLLLVKTCPECIRSDVKKDTTVLTLLNSLT